MKVAIVQEHVDIGRGGAESSVLEMARAIAGFGLDVTVLHAAADPTPRLIDNVTFQPIVVRGALRSLRTYRFVRGVHAYCRQATFDIVHAVTPVLCADVYQPRGGTYPETIARSVAMAPSGLGRAIRRLGKRFNVRQSFLMQIERTLLTRRTERVTVAAISDYVRRQVETGFRFPPDRIRVIFNGVDTGLLEPASAAARAAARAPLGLAADQTVLLFVAHNFRLKGLRELLCALAQRDVNARAALAGALVLVVGRDEAGPYERLAARFGLTERVRFLGPVPSPQPLYASADVLAHPSWYDPCSRVVLEALACGLPVVTTRWNGAAELMDPARHGLVVDDPGDARALAAALEAALRAELRQACQADAGRIAGRISMQRHAQELVMLYQDVRRTRRR